LNYFFLFPKEFTKDFVEKGVAKHFSEILETTSDVKIQTIVASAMVNFDDTEEANRSEEGGRKKEEGERKKEKGGRRKEELIPPRNPN
jgi:hypothetical protein